MIAIKTIVVPTRTCVVGENSRHIIDKILLRTIEKLVAKLFEILSAYFKTRETTIPNCVKIIRKSVVVPPKACKNIDHQTRGEYPPKKPCTLMSSAVLKDSKANKI